MKKLFTPIGFFAEVLASHAKAQGITALDLSKKAGISYRTVCGILHGEHVPQKRIIAALAKALGLTEDALPNPREAITRGFMIGSQASEQDKARMAREHGALYLSDKVREAIRTISVAIGVPDEVLTAFLGDLLKKRQEELLRFSPRH